MKITSVAYEQAQVEALLSGRKTTDRRNVTRCPAKAGDLIWVRESFLEGRIRTTEHFLPSQRYQYIDQSESDENRVFTRTELDALEGVSLKGIKFKNFRMMTRAQSKVTLKVVKSYQQRLHDITQEQAVLEGMPSDEEAQEMAIQSQLGWYQRPRTWFKNQWSRFHDNWDENPLVWVLEFEVIHRNINDVLSELKEVA